jgi:hypothetical protein
VERYTLTVIKSSTGDAYTHNYALITAAVLNRPLLRSE